MNKAGLGLSVFADWTFSLLTLIPLIKFIE